MCTLGARATFVYMLRDCGRSSGKVTFCITPQPGGPGQRVLANTHPSNAEFIIVHFILRRTKEGGEREYEIQIADGNRNFASPGIYIPPSQTKIIKFTLLDSPVRNLNRSLLLHKHT